MKDVSLSANQYKSQKKMKKVFMLVASAALMFSSCIENDGTHYTEILYPSEGGKVLYADQTNDSLKLCKQNNQIYLRTQYQRHDQSSFFSPDL